jgi:hypothetical protein
MGEGYPLKRDFGQCQWDIVYGTGHNAVTWRREQEFRTLALIDADRANIREGIMGLSLTLNLSAVP